MCDDRSLICSINKSLHHDVFETESSLEETLCDKKSSNDDYNFIELVSESVINWNSWKEYNFSNDFWELDSGGLYFEAEC